MTEVLEQVESILDKEIGRLKGQEKIEKCSYLKNRLARAKKIHRSIVVETREAPVGQRSSWEQKAKGYETRIAKLMQDVEFAETSVERDEGAGAGGGRRKVEEMNTKEITQTAMQIQEQTQQGAARAKRMVEETLEMGMAVKDEVVKQGQQMNKIQEDVDTVDSNLKRAEKQLRVFMRRMATDKIFIIFILLIVILIILAIVLFTLKQKGIIAISSSGAFSVPALQSQAASPPS
ncbi:uncharacterized protein EV422DRAFT_295018 [Fimicolochytrium jonesii]|uniref:uncharacterized protein n=1 Tax=Fimicolochytrium jonesii TaxID=1396493 RepID=UPI0022FE0721|nr:uncharacterized protein EV422DRAFT_295018 [Fimicolochytrium jonesii]KAI8816287.1 hypothetical protein EV422DRAFT_295018 [Fimicolochytrium jonesii]